MVGCATKIQWVLKDHRYAWDQVRKVDLKRALLGRTYNRPFFGELVTELEVQSAKTPKDDDLAARVWLVEKQALFLELLLERESPRRAAVRRREDVDRMLVDRGLERWRSHDAAAERQKRADMARGGHTHRDEDSTSGSRRSEQLRSRKGHVMRAKHTLES